MSSLTPLVERYKLYEGVMGEIEDLHLMLEEESDEEMVSLARLELEELFSKEALMALELQAAATKSYAKSSDKGDTVDSTEDSVILEVRPGTGGDEASLFAYELFNSYKKQSSNEGWQWEELSRIMNEYGGLKEGIAEVSTSSYGADDSSPGVWDTLKYESGVHRVQRVPNNDVRIHTSACTVVCLPSPSAVDHSPLPANELKIEVFRASGAGGQHVNTTESAVRVTHIPTGMTAAIQDERSQHKNRDKAMKLVTARVIDKREEEEAAKTKDIRSTAVGSGSRSERIRTYNFKEDRITDHRCKVTVFGCSGFVDGGVTSGQFIEALQNEEVEAVLKEMEERAFEASEVPT
ncbi:hypothetical protein TrRE_jg9871 [Triparma retinervis]|uniref:Prokaryotic-type class I peptide chain release factors domain-containing protein n=1 Tax=Triparma retinervis TaxID=2557542 RepID=A0A9W7CC84_9STRA|nr:hypothetical protein TrRE_jg9871 [Triparma retinervis]